MNNLRCPICQSPLNPDNKTWLCDGSLNAKGTQHPFDVARQGYVNLLPVQSKKSKHPGDSQASILARQRFLQAGFYQPLQTTIANLAEKYLVALSAQKRSMASGNPVPPHWWLDIGCGEGYYSLKIAEVLSSPNLSLSNRERNSAYSGKGNLIAIDISKPAVLELAKLAKQKQQLWSQTRDDCQGTIIPLVASASNLPLADNSVQGISSIFSPILADEMARVLVEDGILLIAKPDEGHLASLREALFDDVREHNSDKFLQQLQAVGFELLHSEKVTSEFRLNTEQLADLLTMTPYSYRAKREKREGLLAQAGVVDMESEDNKGFSTQAKFVVYVLRKSLLAQR